LSPPPGLIELRFISLHGATLFFVVPSLKCQNLSPFAGVFVDLTPLVVELNRYLYSLTMSTSHQQLKELCESIELKGFELATFVKEKQTIER